VSEPCKHERLDDLDLCHNADQWRVAWQGALQGHSDARAEVEDVRRGRMAAVVEVDRLRDAIARVEALLGDESGPLWAVRGVREADIRKALEGKS